MKIKNPQQIESGIAIYSNGATKAASAFLYACEIKKPPKALHAKTTFLYPTAIAKPIH